MHTIDTTTTGAPSATSGVLAGLRRLLPRRPLRLPEALQIAERQADLLRKLRGYADTPVDDQILTGLPRLVIEHDIALRDRAASGASQWDDRRRCWLILINPDEPQTRQRFTTLHEYKHIVDHYHLGILGGGERADRPYSEIVADYFAGCVLMPKVLIRRAYYDGIQRVSDLAELFGVSKRAIEVRLSQLGIVDELPSNESHGYRRQRPLFNLSA